MNTVLWVLQVILSIKFISVAFTHGIRHDQARMQQGIQRMGQIARPLLIVIAMLTLLGSLGLIVPAAFGVLTWITPLTAAILAALMLVSIVFHMNCREKPNTIADIVLFAIAAFVAYGRWVISPL
jgi:isoprenylcysteine carboxyl methyltransferase (ICMT) family protein YpbQ